MSHITSEIKSLSPLQAADFISKYPHASFIDVRSSMEFLFVGHPKNAVNIAWIDEPDWQINPDFQAQIENHVKRMNVDSVSNYQKMPVLLICRSGVRSLEAGECLLNAGFTQVYNILEGFEGDLNEQHQRNSIGGWRFHGLEWEQC